MFTKIARYHAKAGPVTTDDTGAELGTIVVYGSTWDVDLGSDQIQKGAYANTIKALKARAKERGTPYLLPLLHEHQPGVQLGSWYDLREDDTGLKCSGHLALGIEKARDLYLLAKSGMSGDTWSITYTIPPGGASYNRDGIRTITEIDLSSVDCVSFPMNPATSLVSVKDKNRLNRLNYHFNKLSRRRPKSFTGPTNHVTAPSHAEGGMPGYLTRTVDALQEALMREDHQTAKSLLKDLATYNWGEMSQEDYQDLLYQGSVSGGQFWAEQPRTTPSQLIEGTGKSRDWLANMRANGLAIKEWR